MNTATTDKLTFLSAVAVHAEIEDLMPQFKRRHEIEVLVNYDVNPAVAKRVMEGKDFDVGLTNPWYVEEMISRGRIIPNTHVPFGRVPLRSEPFSAGGDRQFARGRARAGANADSIAYTDDRNERQDVLEGPRDDGPAGSNPRSLASDGGRRAAYRCRERQVQYAIAPLSRIIAAPGVEPIATFPSESAWTLTCHVRP